MTMGTHPDTSLAPLTRSSSWPSTRSARCRWTRCRRPTRGIPARRWRWPRWPTRCGSDYLRFDPELPVWANRDRFVLSAGHASTLLYSMLHLAGVQVGQPGLRDRRRAGGVAGRPAPVPAAGLQVPRPPRVPLDLRRGVHHRPAGHRDRHQRRHGHRRAVAGRHVQPARLRAVRLRRLRAARRRLPDGGHRRRGRLAGRAPEAVQPVLDLRQQQDHHRGRHQPGVHRGRAGPVRRLRLGGAARRRRQRPGRAGRGLRRVPGRDRASDADRRGQHHRLRLAEQGRAPHAAHGEPLGVEEVTATKRFYGWPEDATFLVPDGVPRALRRRDAASAAAVCAQDWEALFARYAAEYPEQADAAQPHAAPHRCPTAGTPTFPSFPADAKGVAGRDANAKVLNAVAARVPWLIGGSADLAPSNKSRLTFDGAGDFSADRPGRAQPALRGPRARGRRRSPTGWRCPSCAPTRPAS